MIPQPFPIFHLDKEYKMYLQVCRRSGVTLSQPSISTTFINGFGMRFRNLSQPFVLTRDPKGLCRAFAKQACRFRKPSFPQRL